MKKLLFSWDSYPSGGTAVDPTDDLGFMPGTFVGDLGCGLAEGKAFFCYDPDTGTLKAFKAADTEYDEGQAVSAYMVFFGK